jgi:hypothetical protein
MNMDDQTRQPRSSEDYMAQIIARLNANSASDAWLMVDKMASKTVLVSVEDGKLGFASGIKIAVWRQIANDIIAMIDNTVMA